MSRHPFPGPQPYAREDKDRFFGRRLVAKRLKSVMLVQRCVTLYGPSGSGKSSVMQAAILPEVEEDHRVIFVDSWPEERRPVEWLVEKVSGRPAEPDRAWSEVLAEALHDPEERPVFIFLDQIEQILLRHRSPELDELVRCVDDVVEHPPVELHLVLGIREDHLGRWRQRIRGRRRLIENWQRLDRLSLREITDAVCDAAGPEQKWDRRVMREILADVRTGTEVRASEARRASEPSAERPVLDADEVEAAYAQIVCRTIFDGGRAPTRKEDAPAGQILRDYLEKTLRELGPQEADARHLLEEMLITQDGSRRLVTEREVPAGLTPILEKLERAAIVRRHAQEQQGGTYYELGHDWLALRVRDMRGEREASREAARRARALMIAAFAVMLTLASVVAWYSVQTRDLEKDKEEKLEQAREQERANVAAARLEVAQNLTRAVRGILHGKKFIETSRPDRAALILAEIQPEVSDFGALQAEIRDDWISTAIDALEHHPARATLHGPPDKAELAFPSPDGERLLVVFEDGGLSVVRADGRGDPLLSRGGDEGVVAAAWASNNCFATAGTRGRLLLWRLDGSAPIALEHGKERLTAVSFDRSGARLISGSTDGTARVWTISPTSCAPGEVGIRSIRLDHGAPIRIAALSSDGKLALTAPGPGSNASVKNGRLAVWRLDGTDLSKPTWKVHQEDELKGGARIASFSASGEKVLALPWSSRTVRLWDGAGQNQGILNSRTQIERSSREGPPETREAHLLTTTSVSFDPTGERVLTTSEDGTARIWRADLGRTNALSFLLGSGASHMLLGAWSADGNIVVTTSKDRDVRVWSVKRPVGSSDEDWRRTPREEIRRHQLRSHATSLQFPRDTSSLFVTREADGTVQVWATDVRGARNDSFMALPGGDLRELPERPDGTAAPTLAVRSPNGERVAACVRAASGRGCVVRLWRGGGAPRVDRECPLDGKIKRVDVNDDGHVLVLGENGKLALWNGDGDFQPVETRSALAVTFAALAPGGRGILYIEKDQYFARVRRLDTRADLALWGHTAPARFAAFSPDVRHVVTTAADGTAMTWTLNDEWTGFTEPPVIVSSQEKAVHCAAFDPGGERVAIGAKDGTLSIVGARGSTNIVKFHASDAPLVHVAFRGRDEVLTIDADHRGTVWSISPGVLRHRLREAVTQCLSAELRQAYLQEDPDTARKGFEECKRTPPARGRASSAWERLPTSLEQQGSDEQR